MNVFQLVQLPLSQWYTVLGGRGRGGWQDRCRCAEDHRGGGEQGPWTCVHGAVGGGSGHSNSMRRGGLASSRVNRGMRSSGASTVVQAPPVYRTPVSTCVHV